MADYDKDVLETGNKILRVADLEKKVTIYSADEGINTFRDDYLCFQVNPMKNKQDYVLGLWVEKLDTPSLIHQVYLSGTFPDNVPNSSYSLHDTLQRVANGFNIGYIADHRIFLTKEQRILEPFEIDQIQNLGKLLKFFYLQFESFCQLKK